VLGPRKYWMPILAALSLVLTACGEVGQSATTSTASAPSTAPSTTESDRTPTTLEVVSIADRSRDDLAERHGASPDAIEVLEVERVTWRDGSLGCPEPDKIYSQALVEGWRVTLRLREVTYEYHASLEGEPFLCEEPDPRGAVAEE
jgi:hypothetical protein